MDVHSWTGQTGADCVLCHHLDRVQLSTGQVGQGARVVLTLAERHVSLRALSDHSVGQRPLAGTPRHRGLVVCAVELHLHISRNTRDWSKRGIG